MTKNQSDGENVDIGILIGRWQPVHRGHEALIKAALEQCNKLIIFIGSSSNKRTAKNPFLSNERIDMIKLCFSENDINRMIFSQLSDFYDDDDLWGNAIKLIVLQFSNNSNNKTVGLFGFNKDTSSYYLELFPEYKKMISISSYYGDLSSTQLRDKYFKENIIDAINVNPRVVNYLENFMIAHIDMFIK